MTTELKDKIAIEALKEILRTIPSRGARLPIVVEIQEIAQKALADAGEAEGLR